MIKKIIGIIAATLSLSSGAVETIKVLSPYSASHSGTPAMMRVLEAANQAQNRMNFVMEFRPGGNQTIAVRALDHNSVAIIAPAFVENTANGTLTESDYVPVHALGEACWAVITNGPIESQKELVVGGVGFGNASHLTALALGERWGFSVRYVVFKSNNDALVNMAGNNGVFMVLDRWEAYESMRGVNAKLRVPAVSCPVRLPQAPTVPTVSELGVTAPMVFNITVALKSMPAERRQFIASVLQQAQSTVGAEEIFRLSGIRVPSESVEKFYSSRIRTVRDLQSRYRSQIDQAQR